MSNAEFQSCLDCTFYRPLRETDGRVVAHLCHLPTDCAPPLPEDEAEAMRDWHRDHEDAEYLGTSCDVMRRMGARCGPHATMWSAKEAEPEA